MKREKGKKSHMLFSTVGLLSYNVQANRIPWTKYVIMLFLFAYLNHSTLSGLYNISRELIS